MSDDAAPMSLHTRTENVLRNRTPGNLTREERDVLESAISGTRVMRAGQIAVRQGREVDASTVLIEGLMTRHIDARDGRRHLVGIYLPGDFVDLHAYALKRLDHDVGALTDVTIGIVPHSALERIQTDYPHLTRRLWFLTLLDAAQHRQWVLRLASLNAIGRVAHFLCEMNARLAAIGRSDGERFDLPMTQVDIGEVCSLTNVHVSRVLRELRELGLCTMRASSVELHDVPRLAQLGNFDPHYLYLNDATARLAVSGKGSL